MTQESYKQVKQDVRMIVIELHNIWVILIKIAFPNSSGMTNSLCRMLISAKPPKKLKKRRQNNFSVINTDLEQILNQIICAYRVGKFLFL